jgi:hypothetical protein
MWLTAATVPAMVNDRSVQQELHHQCVTIPLRMAAFLTAGAVLTGMSALVLVCAAASLAYDDDEGILRWWRPAALIGAAAVATLLLAGLAVQLRSSAARFQGAKR